MARLAECQPIAKGSPARDKTLYLTGPQAFEFLTQFGCDCGRKFTAHDRCHTLPTGFRLDCPGCGRVFTIEPVAEA